MRKISLVALCLLFTSHIATGYASCYDCEDDYTAQSFMFTRPLTQGLEIRQSAWHNIVHDRHGCMRSAVQVTALGQQSMTDPRTAGYFLMKHKDMLTVMGDEYYGEKPDAATQRRIDLERDIRAEWLGLPKKFSGKFSINPQQSQVGFIVEYNQMLNKWFSTGFFEYMWIDIQVPFVSVENKMHFKQFDVFNKGTGEGPHDILEAFNQKEWRHGKISDHKRSKIGVENLRFSFGSNYMSDGNFQLSYYSHWSFPVGGQDPACYMFDAVLGSNGHVGMGAGVNVQFVLNKPNCGYDACFYLDLEHTFMIRCEQKRTVDLYGKPWSRYMQFVSDKQGPNVLIPGVNVLTQKFTVRPYSMVDGGFGLRVNKSTFELEAGASVWGRSNEKLDKLVCPFDPIYGIAGVPTDPNAYAPVTASKSTIDKQAKPDTNSSNQEIFIPITTSDFDLESGVSRSVINYRFHVALSKLRKGTNVDGTFCIGAFYEVPQYNSGLNMWGVWGKIGTAF